MTDDTRNPEQLSDVELAAELIGGCRENALRIVREAMAHGYRLGNLLNAAPATMPERARYRLSLAMEGARRALSEEMKARDSLTSPAAVRGYLRLKMQDYEHEAFAVVFLDAQSRVIEAEEMFRGTLTQTSVYPREVVKAALRHNAAAVILAHNHPSGVAEPSLQDQSLTRTLSEALALIDVKVHDHFIVAPGACLSFAERGLL